MKVSSMAQNSWAPQPSGRNNNQTEIWKWYHQEGRLVHSTKNMKGYINAKQKRMKPKIVSSLCSHRKGPTHLKDAFKEGGHRMLGVTNEWEWKRDLGWAHEQRTTHKLQLCQGPIHRYCCLLLSAIMHPNPYPRVLLQIFRACHHPSQSWVQCWHRETGLLSFQPMKANRTRSAPKGSLGNTTMRGSRGMYMSHHAWPKRKSYLQMSQLLRVDPNFCLTSMHQNITKCNP